MSYARRMIITDKHVRCIITIFRAPFPFFVYILTAWGAPVVKLCIPVYLLFLRWLPAIDIYILTVRTKQSGKWTEDFRDYNFLHRVHAITLILEDDVVMKASVDLPN